MSDLSKADVIIIGAGAAGLATARELRRAGVQVVILEARARVGGRIFTYRDPNIPAPIELGAEFLHGTTPLTDAILRDAKLSSYDIVGDHWRAKNGSIRRVKRYWDRVGEVLSHIDPDRTPDQSFDEYLHSELITYIHPRSRRLAREFVEGFHAADSARISERALAQGSDEDEDRMGRVVEGYDRVTAWMAHEVYDAVVFNTIAKRIEWNRHSVLLETTSADGAQSSAYSARAVVVTVPISVLQRTPNEPNSLEFAPELPAMRKTAAQLAMGHVARISLAFSEPFWTTKLSPPSGGTPYCLSFLHGDDVTFSVWWTLFPLRTPVMVGWVGGPQAEALLLQGEGAVRDQAIASLARLTGLPSDELRSMMIGSWTHDWSADPFSGGAYSYALVGGADAAQALAQPIEGTIFFAGEATATGGRNGTVEGALMTGQRAARSLLYSLD